MSRESCILSAFVLKCKSVKITWYVVSAPRILKRYNMKKITALIGIFFVISLVGFAQKVVSIPGLIDRPVGIFADELQIYIVSGAKVFIYSAKDYTFKMSFGKKGEGPGEFKIENNIDFYAGHQYDDLMITTSNKIFFFSKQGKEKRVIPYPRGIRQIKRFGVNYVGRSYIEAANKLVETINLYDPNFKKIKEIYRRKGLDGRDRRIYLLNLEKRMFFKAGEEHIFILDKNTFHIDVFNKNGEFSHSIKQDYPQVKITGEDIQLLYNYYKFLVKDFQRLKPRLVIPDYFPAIYDIHQYDNKLYVLTWRVADKRREILVMDLQGKILLQSFVPHKAPLRGDGNSPYSFYKNRLYQLYDNPVTEAWELHISEIK